MYFATQNTVSSDIPGGKPCVRRPRRDKKIKAYTRLEAAARTAKFHDFSDSVEVTVEDIFSQ